MSRTRYLVFAMIVVAAVVLSIVLYRALVDHQPETVVRINNPPVINSLTADEHWTTPSGSVQIRCDATDPDGDELRYAWSTDVGGISGEGPVVTWTAPEALGEYAVLVEVTDGYGGSAEERIYIRVFLAECPPNTLQLANTELHKAQTAIIAAMADAQRGTLTTPSAGTTAQWSGEPGVVTVVVGSVTYDAADYVDEPFRATYTVGESGHILGGTCDSVGQWGQSCIVWDPDRMSWIWA